jgi:large subunit ribosomal protein L29
MKLYEIKSLTTQDLLNTLKENYEALDNLRYRHSSGQLENNKAIMNTKKTIARILTVIKEREKEEIKK